jgi:HK97 family phage major capsid protein
MYSRLFARSYPNAVWIANQNIIPQLFKMVLAGASSDVPVYLPAGGASGKPFDTLFGKPILFIEQASSIGDVGDLLLVDLSQYLMIDKGGLKTASSIHVRFDYDETCFRFVYRVDGQPSWSSALTPYKGTQTQSPYIALAAR